MVKKGNVFVLIGVNSKSNIVIIFYYSRIQLINTILIVGRKNEFYSKNEYLEDEVNPPTAFHSVFARSSNGVFYRIVVLSSPSSFIKKIKIFQ